MRASPRTLKSWPCSPTLTLDALRPFKWELESRGRTTRLGFWRQYILGA